MKKTLISALAFVLIVISCNKKGPESEPVDETPVIVLNGRSKDTISLNTVYSDPGATASDPQDGNITAAIIQSGVVNGDSVGDYTKKYRVKDAAGHEVEVTRLIRVQNDARSLAGNYAVVPGSCVVAGANYTTNVTVSPSVNNQLIFNPYLEGNLTGKPVVASLTNHTLITVPLLTGSGYSFSATGQITAPKKIALTYFVTNGLGNTYKCFSLLTQQ